MAKVWLDEGWLSDGQAVNEAIEFGRSSLLLLLGKYKMAMPLCYEVKLVNAIVLCYEL